MVSLRDCKFRNNASFKILSLFRNKNPMSFLKWQYVIKYKSKLFGLSINEYEHLFRDESSKCFAKIAIIKKKIGIFDFSAQVD